MQIGTAETARAPRNNQGADDADPLPHAHGQMRGTRGHQGRDHVRCGNHGVGEQHEVRHPPVPERPGVDSGVRAPCDVAERARPGPSDVPVEETGAHITVVDHAARAHVEVRDTRGGQ